MVFKNFFSRYLLLSNSLTFTALFGVGDFVEQRLEIYRKRKRYNKVIQYDISRTIRMLTAGALMSPFVHSWYVLLDRVIVGRIHATVLKKVMADEIIMSPICGVAFLAGMTKMEGHDYDECWKEVKSKFWPMYKVDLCIWPAAQAVNFYLVPSHYRVAYVSFVTLIWNVFLSYIKHKKNDSIDVKDYQSGEEYLS